MRMPFDGSYTMTCNFACHKNSSNATVRAYAGVDWGMPIGTNNKAIEAGTVTTGKGTYGELFANLKSLDGKRVWQYVHWSRFIKSGRVNEGDIIGLSGNTGITTGPHLHLALIENGVRVDPMKYLSVSPAGGVKVGKYIMYKSDTRIRQGNGLSYPITTVAKQGSIWYVIGGPRYTDGYEWWDVRACDQNDGTLLNGTGWSALRKTGGSYWVAVVEKPNKPKPDDKYHVLKDGKEVGAYLSKDTAFDTWYTDTTRTVMYLGKDITSEFKLMANTLEKKIVTLEKQISTLEATIAEQQNKISDLEVLVKKGAEDLVALKEENADLKRQVTAVGQANEKLKTDLAKCQDLSKNFIGSIWGKLYLIFNKPDNG